MDTDGKLLCLLSKLQSMFPRDFRLGAGGTGSGGKVGQSRQRVKMVGKDEKNNIIVQRFVKKAYTEIKSILQYEWKKYKGIQHFPTDFNERYEIEKFIEQQAAEMTRHWRIRNDNREKTIKEIEAKNKVILDERHQLLIDKKECETTMKTIEDQRTRGSNGYLSPTNVALLEAEKQKLKLILEKYNRKCIDPEQYYSQDYLDCRKRLDVLDTNYDKKLKFYHNLLATHASPDQIRDEKRKLAYIEEDYYVLKKIHDDFWSSELKEIKSGKQKPRVSNGDNAKKLTVTQTQKEKNKDTVNYWSTYKPRESLNRDDAWDSE